MVCESQALLQVQPRASCIVLAGHADPAVHTAIGEVLRKLRAHTQLPVAIRTTGALLSRGSICADLHHATHVIVKVDAVTREMFNRVHRPHKGVRVENHIDGVARFRHDYAGSLWVETVLIAGINDDISSIERLFKVLRSLEPQGILLHLHTVTEEGLFARQIREAAELGSSLGEIPVVVIDRHHYGVGHQYRGMASPSGSSSTMTWEASIHRARSVVLARGLGNPENTRTR